MLRRAIVVVAATAAVAASGCAHVSTVRLQPEPVEVAPGLRPIAAIQANVTSFYLLFIPIPGDVDLDRAVNRMLVVAAKTMGADKVAQLQCDVTPDGGIWALRRLIGWRSAAASALRASSRRPLRRSATTLLYPAISLNPGPMRSRASIASRAFGISSRARAANTAHSATVAS